MKDSILIPEADCANVEIGQVVQYGGESCMIVGATEGFAIARKVEVKAPFIDPQTVGDGKTLGRPLRKPEEILKGIPKDWTPMYGPLVVGLVRTNAGKAYCMVFKYQEMKELRFETDVIEEAVREQERVLYILQKHGVKAIKPVGST